MNTPSPKNPGLSKGAGSLSKPVIFTESPLMESRFPEQVTARLDSLIAEIRTEVQGPKMDNSSLDGKRGDVLLVTPSAGVISNERVLIGNR
jgi:hypothetical protein